MKRNEEDLLSGLYTCTHVHTYSHTYVGIPTQNMYTHIYRDLPEMKGFSLQTDFGLQNRMSYWLNFYLTGQSSVFYTH